MKISTILDHIDNGHIALPEFQRGYVWNREQVRGLFASLYRGHPVGGLLVWVTKTGSTAHRGDQQLSAGVVKLLLDGQQRMTSIYGVARGRPPAFFDGDSKTFADLHFHLEDESFEFYQKMKMEGDPLWVNVSTLMAKGTAGLEEYFARFYSIPEVSPRAYYYSTRLTKLISITDTDLHVEEVTGVDKTLDTVVDIFNQVNSGGTKLSKGDLALAKICADWPEARREMKTRLKALSASRYNFDLDWLLRSVNTVLTGEAKFGHLHDRSAEEIGEGLSRASKAIQEALNLIDLRLGLDHDRVLFGRFALPVVARYLDQRNAPLNERERDKLLFWYVQAGMWGRFSGSTETMIDQDLQAIEEIDGGLDRLLENLRLWHGGLRVEPAHFHSWSMGARFYPVLYMLTRMGGARDWSNGLPLKTGMLGKMNALEVHHIFPKSQLYKRRYKRPEVNALANFCFLTKNANLTIGNRLPEAYFPEIESNHPGALASQWIPEDPRLWKIEKYREFLQARRELLAEEANGILAELLHDDRRWLPNLAATEVRTADISAHPIPGGITSEREEQELEALRDWMEECGLDRGTLSYDFTDPETGAPRAVFDLAWPRGIQEELSQPVAVLLDEEPEVLRLASGAGYRCFTTPGDFRQYVERDLLSGA